MVAADPVVALAIGRANPAIASAVIIILSTGRVLSAIALAFIKETKRTSKSELPASVERRTSFLEERHARRVPLSANSVQWMPAFSQFMNRGAAPIINYQKPIREPVRNRASIRIWRQEIGTLIQNGDIMKLTIRRNQVEYAEEKPGMFSKKIPRRGIYFTLSYRIELTPEEESLINKYELGNHIFYEKIRDKINRDVVEERKEPWDLYGIEKDVKEDCKNLKNLFDGLFSYSGEVVVEF